MADQEIKQGMEDVTSDKDFEGRRRLLKASAAAPLIASLSPNCALAATSLTCAEKGLNPNSGLQDAPPVQIDFIDDGSFVRDAAYRLPGTCHVPKGNHAHNAASRGNGKNVIYEIDGVSGYFYMDGSSADPEDITGSSYTAYKCYFVEYFAVDEQTGGVYRQSPGVYPFQASGDVVSGTCLASIGLAADGDISG